MEENVDTSYLWAWGMPREERTAKEKARHEVNLQIIRHSK